MKSESLGQEDTLDLDQKIARWRTATLISGGLLVIAYALSFFVPYASYARMAMFLAFPVCLIGYVFLRLQRAEERIDELEQALARERK